MFFGSKLTSLIFSVKSDVEESRNGGRGWLMVEVGGRGGASGGRGRLRLRALKGIVSHIQHALLPLDEVRRIEKATASAADLWDPRLGCLDARMLVFLIAWRQI